MELLKLLWGSRKAQILVTGGIGAIFAQLLPFLVVVFHWDDARAQLWTQLGNHIESVILLLTSLWAALVALEDSARKFGITAPHPGETPPTTPNRPVS
jgi:hypothetical protein